MNMKRISKLALPILLLAIVLLLPRPDGLSWEGQVMFGVLMFAGSLFLLQPIPLGLAGLSVLVLPLILGVSTVGHSFRLFGNSAVFFLIGAFIIAAAVERTPLHKIVSLQFLRVAGRSPRFLVLATMLGGATLSFIMPEHGVIVLIVPVLMYTLVGMGLVPLKSNLAKSIMIGAAYGCSIGSLATPLGGARNPLTIGFLRLENIHIDFLRWMTMSLPIVLISIIAVWLVLVLVFPPEVKDIKKGRKVIEMEVKDLPSFTRRDMVVLLVLILTIAGFIIFPSFYDVELSLVAILGAIAMFIASRMKWEEVEEKVPWGIILLYGGAVSMGIHFADSGAANWLADNLMEVTQGNVFLSIILVIILTKVLTEFMSNTAAVSILLPIGFAIFTETGLPAEMGAMLVGLSGGLAFMFLISTPGNLISFSSGYFTQKDLLKVGFVANIVTIGVMLLVVYTYWKWIGVW